MSLIGRRITFQNKKLKKPTWGIILDKVHGKRKTKYLVRAVVKEHSDEDQTPEITELFLITPKRIQLVE